MKTKKQQCKMLTIFILASFIFQVICILPTHSYSQMYPVNYYQNQKGLEGEYFNDEDLINLVSTKINEKIDFTWGDDPPVSEIGSKSYSVRWNGRLSPTYSEAYTFYLNSSGGAKLWINNVCIIDNWKEHDYSQDSKKLSYTFIAGEKYNIKVEYYNHSKYSTIKLLWSSTTQSKVTIPINCLYSPDETISQEVSGVEGRYYNGIRFNSIKMIRNDDNIDAYWGDSSPLYCIGDDNFSIVWKGKIIPKYSEYYRFFIDTDYAVKFVLLESDGSEIELFNNTSKKSFSEGEFVSKKYLFKAYKEYEFRLEYFHGIGKNAKIKLLWESQTQPKKVVSKSQLRMCNSKKYDSDYDQIPDEYEIDGYMYNENGGLSKWDGDQNKTYYITNPYKSNSENDFNCDFNKVSNTTLDKNIVGLDNDPMIPIYPIISLDVDSYNIIPNKDLRFEDQVCDEKVLTSKINTVFDKSNLNESFIRGKADFGFFDVQTNVKYAFRNEYKNSFALRKVESLTKSKITKWNTATCKDEQNAAILNFTVKYRNSGKMPIYKFVPEFNVRLGNKVLKVLKGKILIASIKPGSFECEDFNGEVVLNLDELKSIQFGMPIVIDLKNITAKVQKVNWQKIGNDTYDEYDYNCYIEEINKYTTNIVFDDGTGISKTYKVFAGSSNDDKVFPKVTLGQAIKHTLGGYEINSGNSKKIFINNQEVTDEWQLFFLPKDLKNI